MIGEKIGEFTGKVIGTRVVQDATSMFRNGEGRGPCVETSFMDNGKMLGLDCTNVGTYFGIQMHTGNAWLSQGQGILTTKDGETATWTASGCGKPMGRGTAMSWRGSICYQTTCKKLEKLNGLCVVFEHEVDENGVLTTRGFEWR